MPFKSTKQKKWMWANRPDIAQRWTSEGKGYVKKKGRKKSGKR